MTYIILVDILLGPLCNLELVDTNGDLLSSGVETGAGGQVCREVVLGIVSSVLDPRLAVVVGIHDDDRARSKSVVRMRYEEGRDEGKYVEDESLSSSQT